MGNHSLKKNTTLTSLGKTSWLGGAAMLTIASFGIILGPSEDQTTAAPDPSSTLVHPGKANPSDNAPKVDENIVVFPTVHFYDGVCQPLSTTLTVPSRVSIATEESVGMSGDQLKNHWVGSLTKLSDDMRAASEALKETEKNSDSPAHPPLYTVSEQAKATADQIALIRDGFAQSTTDDRAGELTNEIVRVAGDQGSLLTSSVKRIVSEAPLPSQATADAVYALPNCKDVFTTTPQLADGQKIKAAEDFHTKLNDGIALVDSTREQFENLTVSEVFEQTRENVAVAWDARAKAARQSADDMRSWKMPDMATAAEANALSGYVPARDDAVFVWDDMANDAEHQAHLIRDTKDVAALTKALDAASDAAWQKDIAEEKMIIRIQRNASQGI